MDQLKGWLGRLPLAGAAVTLLALLGIWRSNLGQLPAESAWSTLAGCVVGAMALVALLRPLVGGWARAGLISGLAAGYIFYVPPVLKLLEFSKVAMLVGHVIAIGLAVLIARRIPRDREKVETLAAKVNLVCAILLAVTIVPLAVQLTSLEGPRRAAQQSLPAFSGQASKSSPDVWHIIFDRYAGADTLRGSYRFDNQPFITALRQRGFTVQDQAFSNYQRTGHSVASTMNGTLLGPMSEPMQAQAADWVPIYRLMRDNAAIRFFERSGYRTYFAGSWWEPTRASAIADESIKVRAVPQLGRLAVDGSSIGYWLKSAEIPYLDGRGDQCFRANEKFRRLKQIAGTGERKYVFAHFLVPHPPFVLNADGSCRSLDQAKASSRRDNYIAQVQFANREVVELVDAIVSGPRPAIIVIHGDEGPWPEPYIGNERGLGTDPVAVDWSKVSEAKLRHKMSTLLAVRSPGGPPAQMPASPVQIYPAILREYFNSGMPMPPSRNYLFESDTELYRFHDVTCRLHAR